MNMDVSIPYLRVVCVTFKGNADEDESGYVEPGVDTYLIDMRNNFRRYMKHNRWEGQKVGGWEIIHSEIIGPGSSGYPNSLIFYVGIFPAWSYTDVLKLINNFSI